ncbi:ATP-binding protein [Acetanaerobacterium elongatum]|uniref:GHKL domain-containing protein n=1 Tax=Acetanaerobacterium elongatum TaxID=258515 RepID=A0A1G9XFH4_9FIRM|nr:ATP-binding protein [Acetanaerobacterium elongatum]SDM95494.1 GHKL domain-containing protein [Acetanaerobacterium elongatum]
MNADEVAWIVALAVLSGVLRVCLYNRVFIPRFGRLNYLAGCLIAVGFALLRLYTNASGAASMALSLCVMAAIFAIYQSKPAVFVIVHFGLIMFQLLVFSLLTISPWHSRYINHLWLLRILLVAEIIPIACCIAAGPRLLSYIKGIDEAAAKIALVLPLFSLFLFSGAYLMGIIDLLNDQQKGYGILIALSIAGILQIIAIVLFYQNRLRRQRIAFMQQQLALQQAHYRSLYSCLNDLGSIRMKSCELIAQLSRQLDEGSYDEALAVVEEISSGIELSGSMQVCRNKMINALLSHKFGEAKRQGITCEFEVTLNESTGVDDISLCSIFGNIMDNAIRACGMLKAGEPKVITLKCAEIAGMLIIKQENPLPEGFTLTGSAPETTKPDKQKHGIGTKILSRVAARYDGTVDFSVKDNRFCVTVMLIPKRD